jgi:hypothetical protein
MSQRRNQLEAGSNASFLIIFQPWRWRQYASSKRRCSATALHCITLQKRALRSSNPTQVRFVYMQRPVFVYSWSSGINYTYNYFIVQILASFVIQFDYLIFFTCVRMLMRLGSAENLYYCIPSYVSWRQMQYVPPKCFNHLPNCTVSQPSKPPYDFVTECIL